MSAIKVLTLGIDLNLTNLILKATPTKEKEEAGKKARMKRKIREITKLVRVIINLFINLLSLTLIINLFTNLLTLSLIIN